MKRKESVAIGVVAVVITLILGSLFVVAGCGGDETTTTAAETSTSEAASTESTAPTETTAPSEGEVTGWLPSGLSGTPASGEPFKLGIVQAVTGWAAGGEIPAWDAFPFIIEEYNKAGGFMGRPIEIQQKDMQSDPALSPAVTQELVDWGAQAFVAPAFPGMIAGVVQVASKNGLPVVSALCTTPSATWVGGAPCYLSAFGDPAMAAAMAEYALGDGAQTAYLLGSPDAEYTEGLAKYFGEAFEHGGGTVVGTDTFSIGQEDFSAQVTKIAALDPQPDVIWKGIIIPQTGVFMKQLRAAGVTSLVVGNDGDFNQVVIDMGGDTVEGMVVAAHGFPEPGNRNALFQEGLTAFLGRPTEDPSLSSLAGDAMAVYQKAVEDAGSLDPAAILAALPNVESIDGVNAVFTLKGTDGIPIKPVKVVGIENGQFVLLDEVVPSWVPEPMGKPPAQ